MAFPYSPAVALLAATMLCVTARAEAQAPVKAAAPADTLRADTPLAALRVGADTSDTFMVRDGQRRLLATYVEETSRTAAGYLVVGRNVRPDGAVLSTDSLVVATGTLLPIWHWDRSRAGSMRVRFADGRMRGSRVDTAGVATEVDMPTRAGGMWDYSIASRMVNLLPLRAGYTAVLPSWDIRRGAQAMRIAVVGEEAVEAKGRSVPTWRVEVDYGPFRATRWIDRATRKDVRTVASVNGNELVIEPR